MIARSVLLLSGGLDSAVCLWWARRRGWEPYPITFNYYQRHPKELEATKKLSDAAGCPKTMVIDLPFLREIVDQPIGEDAAIASMKRLIPPVYIPARNAIFYSVASWYAEVVGAQWIVGGHHRLDFNSFPDSTPEYFSLLNGLLRSGLISSKLLRICIVTPLSTLDKLGVLRLGLLLGVPVQLTWSCHERLDMACGKCAACKSRLEAFHTLGIKDPVPYADSRLS